MHKDLIEYRNVPGHEGEIGYELIRDGVSSGVAYYAEAVVKGMEDYVANTIYQLLASRIERKKQKMSGNEARKSDKHETF